MILPTIAAISTPNAAGGIAVIRISGDDALSVAEKIFTPYGGKKVADMEGYTCAYGICHDGGQRLDKYLTKALCGIPAPLMYKYIRKKRIKVNGKRAKENDILSEGDVIELYIPDEFSVNSADTSEFDRINVNLDVVYEDGNIIICEKRPGVLSHTGDKGENGTAAIPERDTLIFMIWAYLYKKGEYDPGNAVPDIVSASYAFRMIGVGKDRQLLTDGKLFRIGSGMIPFCRVFFAVHGVGKYRGTILYGPAFVKMLFFDDLYDYCFRFRFAFDPALRKSKEQK